MKRKSKLFPTLYLSAIVVAIIGIIINRYTFPMTDVWIFSMLNSVSIWMISIPLVVPIIHWLVQPKTKIHLKKLWRSIWK